MEILLYYVLPNLVLFGGIYVICKYVETNFQDIIDNYDEYQKKLLDFKKKLKYT
jgi:hypothetical protein